MNASIEQIEIIRKLKQNGEFEKLEEPLKEIAEITVVLELSNSPWKIVSDIKKNSFQFWKNKIAVTGTIFGKCSAVKLLLC